MSQRIREWLILILIGFLPLHALMVTVGTRLLMGSGQAPLSLLAGWKELVLGVILVVTLWEILAGFKHPFSNVNFDTLDGLIVGLVVLGLIIPSSNFLFGFKYTLFPLCVFLVLRRVSWSDEFKKRVPHVILSVGGVVAGYGIFTFFLPSEFFVWLGYSDLHSLYLPDGPLAAFQQISDTGIRRIQSTMSGPNQLGLWLLIPLSMGIGKKGGRISPCCHSVVPLLIVALIMTFSRAAWISGLVICAVYFFHNSKCCFSTVFKMTFAAVVLLMMSAWLFPEVLLRATSSRAHLERPLEAMWTIAGHPLGLGLGSAGPASNRSSDACVFLEEGADASWAADRPELCVFTGETQVQPLDRTCICPVLPENWYLQVGVELGFLGLIVFITLIILVIRSLRSMSYALLPFLGISIAALFLHAWEDAAVAYTVWILVAMMLPCIRDRSLSSTSADSTHT